MKRSPGRLAFATAGNNPLQIFIQLEVDMKVLYVASEARPFAVSGGLADVAGSLPQSLNRMGIDCRVVIPLYDVVTAAQRERMTFVAQFYVPVAWRMKYCAVFEAEYGGATFYFVDSDYFKRRNKKLYGEYDDAERFAFFSRAILEMLPHVDFFPDIINANDWQTALVPIYRHIFYPQDERYARIKTVYTIHNLAFQGKYGVNIFGDVFGFPDFMGPVVDYEGGINLMKGAMQTADKIVTVSPTYAKEITGEHMDSSGYDFSENLAPFIQTVKHNSIDPETDETLYKKYNSKTVVPGKAENKRELQKELAFEEGPKLEENPDIPLIGIVARIDSRQKGGQLVIEALERGLLDHNDAQLVLLGTAADGDAEGKKMEEKFKKIASRYPGKMIAYIRYDAALAQRIYAAADIFLMPSKFEPCGLGQIMALKYGTIPVVRETGGLVDTVTESADGEGNGFTFRNYSGAELKEAIECALAGYADCAGWNSLVQRAMKCDFSWEAGSANEYADLYHELSGK
jgi:starch synthase